MTEPSANKAPIPGGWRCATPAASIPLTVADIAAAVRNRQRANERLEALARERYGAVYAGSVSAGKWALWLLLEALKRISPRRRALLPAYGSPTVVRAAMHAGLEIALCDVSRADFNIDASGLREAVGEDTLCVVPQHLFGKACDMPAIVDVAQERGAYVIEDVAQATDAPAQGRCAGTWGDAAFYSFARGKGSRGYRGGLLTVKSDQELARAVDQIGQRIPRMAAGKSALHVAAAAAVAILSRPRCWYLLRNCSFLGVGRETQEMVPALTELPDWQAELARRALEATPGHNARRAEWGRRIHEALSELPQIQPQERSREDDVFVRLAVRVTPPLSRDRIVADLRARGIDASPWYSYAAHQYPWWPQAGPPGGTFPVAEALPEEMVVLPVHYAMDELRLTCVVETFRRHAGLV